MSDPSKSGSPKPTARTIALVGPGLLVAATGVGAGDLATAGFTGAELGLAVSWAVVVGAVLKFVVTEGIARWQVATGETLLAGLGRRAGPIAGLIFLVYALPWLVVTGGALISACAATTLALIGVEPSIAARLIAGATCSAAGVALALAGGFRLFERTMAVCVGAMFLVVVVSAVATRPDLSELARGLFIPRIPDQDGALGWTVALIGGVGGTLTILCYGGWMRDHAVATGHTPPPREALRGARLDLALGYAATAVFGLAMIVIASGLGAEGKGSGLIVALADRLGDQVAPWTRWAFLVGACAAVFSSLLGVWQAFPQLVSDACRASGLLGTSARRAHDAGSTGKDPVALVTLVAIATIPLATLVLDFSSIQKAYGVYGATFVPLLALVLLLANGRRAWLGEHRNGPIAAIALIVTLAFFGWLALR